MRKDMDNELLYEFFQKIFCCARTVGCQIGMYSVHTYVLKGFILVVSTVRRISMYVCLSGQKNVWPLDKLRFMTNDRKSLMISIVAFQDHEKGSRLIRKPEKNGIYIQ